MRIKPCLSCSKPVSLHNSNQLPYCNVECRIRHIASEFSGFRGCWNWPKSKTKAGYGQLVTCKDAKPKVLYAHRLSVQYLKGVEIPDGHFVCHRCDNPSCFNPDHLFVGTQKDNMQDMISKGRSPDHASYALRGKNHPSVVKNHRLRRGENHYASKLSEQDVKKILQSKEKNIRLAEKYMVSAALISDIKNRKIWKHLSF